MSIMKRITKLGKKLMLVFLVLVAASTIFLSSPAVAATDTIDTTSSPDRSNNRVSGVVTWYNESKGLGFIKRHDNGGQVVVFENAVRDTYGTLTENQEVEFELQNDGSRFSATKIVIKE